MHGVETVEMQRSSFLPLEDVQTLVADKTVALVGNAQTLLDQAHGETIDSYDLVVRLNRGVPDFFPEFPRRHALAKLTPEDYIRARGKRMDVWGGVVAPKQSIYVYPHAFRKKRTLPDIPHSVPEVDHPTWHCDLEQLWIVPYGHYHVNKHLQHKAYDTIGEMREIEKMWTLAPSSGFVLLYLLLEKCKPARVDLFGFDFFSSLSYPSQCSGSGHSVKEEKEWVDQRGLRVF